VIRPGFVGLGWLGDDNGEEEVVMIGKIGSVVLDTADPRGLARFYCQLLGYEIVREDGDWIDIGRPDNGQPTLSFQHAPDHQPPQWPDPAHPQQFHLDIDIEMDIEEAEQRVLALGAVKLGNGDGNFRVYADPSGHPFCLCW
jgi:catechol-2,3-dioxygenase